jgi:hypothetical protein
MLTMMNTNHMKLFNQESNPKSSYDYFVHSRYVKNKDYHRTWKEPKKNDVTTIHNKTCEVCSRLVPIASNVLKCMYCNVVSHFSCYRSNYPSQARSLVNKGKWSCFACQDSIQYDLDLFGKLQTAEKYQKLYDDSATLVLKNWRRFHERKRYLRVYSAIVRIQMNFQMRKKKREFQFSIQNKLRAVKIKINSINNLLLQEREGKLLSSGTYKDHNNTNSNTTNKLKKREYNIYYLITVFDQNNNKTHHSSYEHHQLIAEQTWKLESSLLTVECFPQTLVDVLVEEKLILGGVSGFQTIVISLFQKANSLHGRDIFLGQIPIELRQNNLWKTGGKFKDLELQDYQYELKDSIGRDQLKIDFSFFDQQQQQDNAKIPTLSVEVITTNTMSAECCHCFGSSLEDVLRELGKCPDTAAYTVPHLKTTERKNNITQNKMRPLPPVHSSSYSSSLSSSSRRSSRSGGDSTSLVRATTTSSALKSLTAAGSSTTSEDNNHQHNNTIMKKMWIAVFDGKLYLYARFGDPLKCIIDLHYFNVSFDFSSATNNTQRGLNSNFSSFTKNGNIIYKLSRMGFPDFHFYPMNENDIFAMKCAFLTSLRLAKGFAVHAHSHLARSSTVKEINANKNSSNGRVTFQLPSKDEEEEDENETLGTARTTESDSSASDSSSTAPSTAGNVTKFDINSLIGDLLALEILRTKRNALKEVIQQSSASTTSMLKNRTSPEKLIVPSNEGIQIILSAPTVRKTVQLAPITKQQPHALDLKAVKITKLTAEMKKKSNPDLSLLSRTASTKDILKRSSSAKSLTRKPSQGIIVKTNEDPIDEIVEENTDENLLFQEQDSCTDLLAISEEEEEEEEEGRSHLSPSNLKKDKSLRRIPSLLGPIKQKTNPKLGLLKQKSFTRKFGRTSTNLLRSSIDDSVLRSLNVSQFQLYQSMKSEVDQQKEVLSDTIKTQLLVELTSEELVINEKRQNLGQGFIQLLMNKANHSQIQNHTFHEKHPLQL